MTKKLKTTKATSGDGGKPSAGVAAATADKPKWTNRERALVFCSRGASHRDRHLMLV
jgi:hypothetical protein